MIFLISYAVPICMAVGAFIIRINEGNKDKWR